jgi:Calcium/calmodulin dependent protein kinase II association domain
MATDDSFFWGLNEQLLAAASEGDWLIYEQLVHPEITCFEPEAQGRLVSAACAAGVRDCM